MSTITFVMQADAEKVIEEFRTKHPSAYVPITKRYFFGLRKRTIYPTFLELIRRGEITPQEADAVRDAYAVLSIAGRLP